MKFEFFFLFLLQANMDGSNTPPRCPTPGDQEDYDVTRMREDDFERLAVYMVPDVPCERGTIQRADKTLPRSLTLKPSLVLLTPNSKVNVLKLIFVLLCKINKFFANILHTD